jgi:hypothetical protein
MTRMGPWKETSPQIVSRVNDMSAPRLSIETKQAIIRDYLAKIPTRELAAKYGVHQSYPGMLWRRSKTRRSWIQPVEALTASRGQHTEELQSS